MAGTNGVVMETQVSTVEALNDKGIKVGGRWWNFSRYYDVTRPERGQQVALEAKGHFIQMLTIRGVVESAKPEQTPDMQPTSTPSPTVDTRDLRIIRQTALKAATNFLALRSDATVGNVIGMAELLEAWVLRRPNN